MNRIEERMEKLKAEKKKALITYITAGLPDMERTKQLIKAQEEAGTDVIELGIPFSDPIADGPVIQQASYEAIKKGANLEKALQAVKTLRSEGVQIPVVFMLYYNTILYFGLEKFAGACKKAGVDGLIIPDLPYEEQGELKAILDASKQEAPILLQLVSPVSKGRIPMLLKEARGFVYCVSSMGVTGQQAQFHQELKSCLNEVRNVTKIPVMMGFGIRTAKDVKEVTDEIDGAIVGSHFITLLKESGFDPETAKEYCRNFKRELNAMGETGL